MAVAAGVPGGLVGGPRAYVHTKDQFRGFQSHRVQTRKGVFLHKKILAESARARTVSEQHSMKVDEQQWEW